MRSLKNLITIIIALIMVAFSPFQISAHDAMLDVDYDPCNADDEGANIDEIWYILNGSAFCKHLSHTEYTIKYYFEETSKDGTYTWTTDVSQSVANEIKSAYANSMKKWNNVYFYAENSFGNLVKRKIISVEAGTATNHNLTIYPSN